MPLYVFRDLMQFLIELGNTLLNRLNCLVYGKFYIVHNISTTTNKYILHTFFDGHSTSTLYVRLR